MIAVTGLMRSGTSPLAKMLHQMGVEMGAFQRFPSINKYAHFEWEDAALSEPLLRMLSGGGTWVKAVELLEFYVKQRREDAERRAWGAKTPFLMPFVADLRRACEKLGEPLSVVLTDREYSQTLSSLERQASHLAGKELKRVRKLHIGIQEKLAPYWYEISKDAEVFPFKDTKADLDVTVERLAAVAGYETIDFGAVTRGIHRCS